MAANYTQCIPMYPLYKYTSAIGSRLTLLTYSDIRYEGILRIVDVAKECVTLGTVRIFGTEHRITRNRVEPHPQILEYFVFHAHLIKEMLVLESFTPLHELPKILPVNLQPYWPCYPFMHPVVANPGPIYCPIYQNRAQNETNATPIGTKEIAASAEPNYPSAPQSPPNAHSKQDPTAQPSQVFQGILLDRPWIGKWHSNKPHIPPVLQDSYKFEPRAGETAHKPDYQGQPTKKPNDSGHSGGPNDAMSYYCSKPCLQRNVNQPQHERKENVENAPACDILKAPIGSSLQFPAYFRDRTNIE